MLSFSSELLRTPWSHLGDLRCEGFSKVYALHVQVWLLRDASLPFTTYSMRFFAWLKWLLSLRLCVWMIISVRKSSVHFPGWSIPELSRPVPLVLVTSFITLATGDWKQQVYSHPEKKRKPLQNQAWSAISPCLPSWKIYISLQSDNQTATSQKMCLQSFQIWLKGASKWWVFAPALVGKLVFWRKPLAGDKFQKILHRDRLLKMPGGYLHPVLGRGHTHGILQVQTFISKNLPKSCWWTWSASVVRPNIQHPTLGWPGGREEFCDVISSSAAVQVQAHCYAKEFNQPIWESWDAPLSYMGRG